MRSVPTGTVQLQSTMRVSSPRDPAEREADATAKKIMRMAAPEVSVASGEGRSGRRDALLSRKLESPYIARFASSIQLMRQHAGAPAARATANVAAEIAQSQGFGAPLPAGVRKFMEPRFGADFSKVRIHTGEKSARLNRQVSAQAFTVGNQIFFGKGKFQPETTEGRELLAHELTHTIQQGGAVQQSAPVQRREDVTVTEQSSPHVQRLGVSDALGYFADAANAIPGYRMFTIVLGVNPITMSRVDRSAANILRAVVEFLPGGNLITRALDNYGIFERVGGWIEQQLGTLGLTGSTIRESINRFLDSLSWTDIANLGGVWERARRIFTEPIDRIIRFARGLFGTIMGFIKDAVLRPIAELASRTRGWDLLCAVLGVNPITGDAVPRTAETLIGGFMKLIGQEEIWENIKRGNAIARAWSWFQGALSGLMGFVRQIPQRFVQAVTSLGIEDLVALPRAFARVAGVFGDFIGSFLSWAGNTAWDLLEIIFSVVAPSLMVYLRRAAGAFRTILQNPVAFAGYMVRAAMQGFRQFASRFLTHLRGSLIGWLTGALSGANIYVPQGLNLREIIKFVLSVLGLTWQNIRQKIVRVIGEPAMRVLETGFELVMTLVTQGPAAAWEKLQESLSNLREMVIEQIMAFVQDRVVTAAVTRLLSMLSPAGAFIQAILATYNTVMFFVERMRQIARVATSFIDSIAAIAAGNIASAANRVEQTMGGMLTLVISFLARIAGLGRVTDAVTNVVNRVRQPIDRALDRVVEWIVAQARRLGRLVAQAGLPQDPHERLRLGMDAAMAAVNRFAGSSVGQAVLNPLLAAIRIRYGFRSLVALPEGGRWAVEGEINPKVKRGSGALVGTGASTALEFVRTHFNVPGLPNVIVPASDEMELVWALRGTGALAFLSGNQGGVTQLLVYLKGTEAAKVTKRLQNLVDVNTLFPGLNLPRLGANAPTAKDNIVVSGLKHLDGTELTTVRTNAGAGLNGLFNLRMPAGGSFDGNDLGVAVKIYATITNAAALSSLHMQRWVRSYKAGVKPMRMPTVAWNTGVTGLRQHFEKHPCGQHGNPDASEAYQWATYLGYASSITKDWVLVALGGGAVLSTMDETNLFGASPAVGNAQLTVATAVYFFQTFVPGHPSVLTALVNQFMSRYEAHSLADLRDATRAFLGFGVGKTQIYGEKGAVFLVASEVGTSGVFEMASAYMPSGGASAKMASNASEKAYDLK